MKHFAVFGHPIAQSYSPLLHRLFAKQAGIELDYQKVDVEPSLFESTVQDFFANGGSGLNITVPFKLKAFEMVSPCYLSDRAKVAGSVNTLWMQDGHLHGCNTDGVGLLDDIHRLGFSLTQKRVLILGAGGAVQGVLLPILEEQPSHLHIANRTVEKAQHLIEKAQHLVHDRDGSTALSASSPDHISGQWDIVINASSGGLSGQLLPLPPHLFAWDSLVYDMIYRADGKTPFLTQAKSLGASTLQDGLGMLVFQGAHSFSIWHGVQVDGLPIVSTLREHLQQANKD